MPSTIRKHFTWIVCVGLLIAGCNYPRGTPRPSHMVSTAAAQTVLARLTQAALETPSYGAYLSMLYANREPTAPPPTQPAPTLAPVFLPSPTLPAVTPPSPTPIRCDQANFVQDVTIPDGTIILPGTAFTKVWRLRNSGSCTWTTSYALVFSSGQAMTPQATYPLPANVAPGQTIDISITFTAPQQPGKYRSSWLLRNASGQVFGLGENASKPFWVEIVIPQATVSTTPTASATPSPTLPPPTTAAPTTAVPTTAVPTTEIPTTAAPTIETPTETLTTTTVLPALFDFSFRLVYNGGTGVSS